MCMCVCVRVCMCVGVYVGACGCVQSLNLPQVTHQDTNPHPRPLVTTLPNLTTSVLTVTSQVHPTVKKVITPNYHTTLHLAHMTGMCTCVHTALSKPLQAPGIGHLTAPWTERHLSPTKGAIDSKFNLLQSILLIRNIRVSW